MSKYVEIAVGWLKDGKKGQYVSAVVAKGNPATGKPGLKLIAQFDNGTEVEVKNFAMFFNENKKSEKAPDVQFTFSVEE